MQIVGTMVSRRAGTLINGLTSSPTLDRIDEATIVAQIRAGDATAFRTLFLATYGMLCTFADRYVHDTDVAQEIAQDVLCAVWQRHTDWLPRAERGVRAYLFAAVRNRALRYLQHERLVERQATVHAESGDTVAMGEPPIDGEAQVIATALRERFTAVVRALPERQRLVVVLRWKHQMTHAEIAQILGISVKGVETQLGRAMRVLRTRLRSFRE